MKLTYHSYSGIEAREFAQELGELRITVFKDFPYLYDGTLDYEMKYLETYFKSPYSLIYVVRDGKKIVGATTGIYAEDEEESFKKPIQKQGLDPRKVFYFGESVLLPAYRGQGIGKKFFEVREAFAKRGDNIRWLTFCSVERSLNHPLRPEGYKDLEQFWTGLGFKKVEGFVAEYKWKDKDQESETPKKMQFWLKKVR